VLERSKKELTIEEAKANFRSAMMEMDPVSVIRKRPIHVLGAAVLAGLTVGIAGKKISRALLPGSGLVLGLIKKLI
jgi:hypothetical protein